MVAPNQALIQEKSDVVLRCLQRLRSKTPVSVVILEGDIDAQDILIVNLERAIQECVDIAAHIIAYTPLPAPTTMSDAFITLEKAGLLSHEVASKMQKAVGMRNLLLHEYQKLDWTILWNVLTLHLQYFFLFLEEVKPSTSQP